MTGSTTDTEVVLAEDGAQDADTETGTPSPPPDRTGGAGALTGGVRRGLDRATRWLARLDRRGRAAIALALVALVAAGSWWQLHRDDLPDGAAFRVGDTVVTSAAVQKRIESLKALYGVKVPTGAKHAAFERDAAKSMAVQIILQDEADRRGLAVKDADVDGTLNRLISQRYPDGGRTAFIAALGQLGANEAQVRMEIRDQILVSEVFDAVTKGITVSDADVRRAFTQRRSELATPVKRDLRNIVVADRATAERIRRQAAAGASFASLASRYSLDGSTRDSGGELGAVSASELASGYAKVAFAAPVGGVFGPVKDSYGWNVGMVERTIPARPAVFAKVKGALKKTLLAERSVARWRAWLGKAITDAHVEYADAYRPAHPDAVPDVAQTGTTQSP